MPNVILDAHARNLDSLSDALVIIRPGVSTLIHVLPVQTLKSRMLIKPNLASSIRSRFRAYSRHSVALEIQSAPSRSTSLR